MRKFIVQRVGRTLLLILGVSLILFIFIDFWSTGDLSANTGEMVLYPINSAQNMANNGLTDNFFLRYFNWLGNLVRGDLGMSLQVPRRAVVDMVWESLPRSLALVCSSLVISIIISIPLGIWLAVRRKRLIPRIIDQLVSLGMSLPAFILSFIAIFVFYIALDVLPMGGSYMGTYSGGWLMQLWHQLKYYILPLMGLSLGITCILTRFAKVTLEEVLEKDYIRTARAKGLKEFKIVFKHALKNASIPWVTNLALGIPMLFSELLIVEVIFSIYGLGKELLEALRDQNYPVFLGFAVFLTLIVVVTNLFLELMYGWLDPRISYE